MKRIEIVFFLLLAIASVIFLQSNSAKASDCWNPDGTHNDIYEFEEIGREEAACTKEGVVYLRCTGCQEYVKKQVINMKGHDFSVLLQEVEATDHRDGFLEYQCSRCDEKIVRNNGYAKHVLRTKLDTDPTCTVEGRYFRYCIDCDYIEVYPIAATGHDWRQIYSPSANCGHVEYKRFECERCHDIRQEEIPPTGNHVFQERITEWPTCIQTGKKLITCQNCEYSEEVIIPKSEEHLWSGGSWSGPVERCYEITVEYECSLCHKKKTEIIPPTTTEHFYQENSWKAASCTEDGEIEWVDWMCGLSYVEKTPAYGHDWVPLDNTEPQCNREVVGRWQCSRCYEVKEEVIPATGQHTLVEMIIRGAVCGADGEKKVYCLNCDYSVIEKIPAPRTAHEWQVKTAQQPTCLEKGITVERCSICGSEKTTETPAIGHKWDEGVIQEDGTVLFTCANDSSHTKLTLGDKPSETDSLGTIKEEPNEPENKAPEEEPADNRTEDSGNNAEQKQEEKNDVIKAEELVDVVIVETQESNNATEENGTDAKGGSQPLIIIILSAIPIAGCAVAVKMGWLQKVFKMNK